MTLLEWIVSENAPNGSKLFHGCHVPALGKTPCNRVKDPQESSQAAAHHEGLLDVLAESPRVEARLPHELVDDIEESDATCDLALAMILGEKSD